MNISLCLYLLLLSEKLRIWALTNNTIDKKKKMKKEAIFGVGRIFIEMGPNTKGRI